jgi:hypothetical protein
LFLGRFWQNLAILGKSSWYGSRWQHALFWKENKNVITYAKSIKILRVMACWKAVWIFSSTKKVSKIQLQIEAIVACLKSLNSIYRIHSLLRVKKHMRQNMDRIWNKIWVLYKVANKTIYMVIYGVLYMTIFNYDKTTFVMTLIEIEWNL